MTGNIYERLVENAGDRKTPWGLLLLNKHGILAVRMGGRRVPKKTNEIKVNAYF